MSATEVLFLCTGNTCRSAYAEASARERFPSDGITFSSAGTHAIDGNPVTVNTNAVAAERGIDISRHRATPLSSASVPDLVLGMEHNHLVAARARFPDLDEARIRLLGDPGAILDPYGMDLDTYRATADRIDASLDALDLGNLR